MNSKRIAEVYEKNDQINDRLLALIGSLDADEIDRLPEGGEWTIANIVEHVSIVETGMTRICAKLLRKAEAEGRSGDGSISFSDLFAAKTMEIADLKLEAPDLVKPTCEQPIEESLKKLNDNQQRLEELRLSFEKSDSTNYRFPHPFLGELSAGEWLMLIGGHKARHIKQIEKMVG
jgi:hypothetical protein